MSRARMKTRNYIVEEHADADGVVYHTVVRLSGVKSGTMWGPLVAFIVASYNGLADAESVAAFLNSLKGAER